MKKLECYEYCDYDSSKKQKPLFGHSFPYDDYFNDNLDQYFDEDDYYDYDHHPEEKFALEEKEYTYSHKAAH